MDRLSENKNVNSESKNLGVNKEIYDIIEGSGAKIEKTNLGLSINLGEKKDNKLFLKKLIGEIYKGGYCIQDINIFGIMECVNNGKKSLILGAGFKKFDSYEKEIYESKLKIESNCAKFDFFVTYDEETDTEFNAEYDKVIMTLLQNGIVYGINYDLINNVVNGLEAKSIQVVAESEEVQEFKDGMKKSYIKYLKGGKSNKAIKEESIVRDLCSKNDSDKAHRSSYKQMFPMTFAYEGLNIIAELVAPKSGKTYRDMFGNDVSISSNNIDLKDYSGEGTKIRNVDGVQQIIATKDGYVDIDPKTGKINLLTKADYSGNIDEETGSLNILAPEFNLQGDIKKGYELLVNDCTVQGNIYGNIYSKGGSITINGKCIGGEIETVNGKILINGDIIDNSNIISENGTIIVENVKDSVIIGNDILIKNAEGCKIIGHKVKILKSIGNEIIGDYLHINELVDKKDNKNIIYSFLFNIGKIIDTLDTLYKDYLNLSKFLIDLKKKKENLLFKLNDGINYDTEYKDYYEIERKVRKGEIKLNKLSDEKKQVLEKVLNIIKDRRQELKSDLNTTTNLEKKTLTEKNQLNNKIKSLEIKMNEFKVSNLEKGYFVQKSNGDSFDNRLYSVPVSVKELLNSKIGFEKKIKILKGDIDVSYVDYLNDLFGSFVSNLKLQEVYTEKTNTKDGRERFNTVRSFHRTVLVADDNIQEQVDNIKESHDILVNNVLKAKMLDIGINGIGLVIKNDGTIINKGDQLFLELKDEGGYIKFNFIVDRKEANENYIRFGGHFEGIDLNTELKLLNIKKSYENSVKS